MTTHNTNDTHDHAPQPIAFEFTGRGGEYFRIWIVNLALTILTLGIYSAWAKVRRLQYFYRNTSLAGGSFDYHGNPMAILKGRLIGIGLLLIYNITVGLNVTLGLAVFGVLILILPWLLQRSLCFRLANSSYRGLRFRFLGTVGGAYRAFLMWPLLGYASLSLAMPLAHQRIKAYQHGNSAYGTSPFGFQAGPGKFYGVYFKMLLLMLLLAVPLILAVVLGFREFFSAFNDPYLDKGQRKDMVGMMMLGFFAFYLLLFLVIGPWFAARMQNLVWNGTALGPHVFASNARARDLLGIYLTNFLAIVLTLGLFKPYADIRLARYRMEHLALQADGSLDAFIADQTQTVGAMGQETAEVFDFDISF